MRLYMDGMFFRSTGVGRVFENLLDALLLQPGIDRIETLVPANRKAAFRDRFDDPRIHPRYVPYGPMTFGDLFRKNRDLREIAPRVSLFIFPGHNVPFSVPGEYIMTVHDLTVFSPRFHITRIRRVAFRLLLSRALSGARKVVAVSGTTREALLREFPVPGERVVVIHNWVEERFFTSTGPDDVGQSPVGGDYLLYVGLRIAHKNLDGLIRGFLEVAEDFPGLRLVVAGSRYRTPDMVDRWKADPRVGERLLECVDPSDDKVRRLIAGARAFVFPSLAEGFGLPPLEAMAGGLPVICSDIPVFREVYGEAVRYVDPERPASIADGIRSVLRDANLRAELSLRGRERASRYRREKSIREYLDLLA